MIRNYIFDFGNVLAEFYPEKLTAPHVTDAEALKRISEVLFDRIYWDNLDWGAITDEYVKTDVRRRLPEELGDAACEVYDNWVRNLTPVPGMQKLVADLRKTDAKIYLLSNISIGFANTYHEVAWITELFEHFDGLVLSGIIGMAKPDEKIFRHLLGKFDLQAEECLFIDDNAKNIDAAKALGINGYLFDGDAEKLREHLGI